MLKAWEACPLDQVATAGLCLLTMMDLSREEGLEMVSNHHRIQLKVNTIGMKAVMAFQALEGTASVVVGTA